MKKRDNPLDLHDYKWGVGGSLAYSIFRKGRLVEYVEAHNLVVNAGRNMLARMIGGLADTSPVFYIGFGTGQTPEALTDVSLENQLLIPVLGVAIHAEDTNTVVFEWCLNADQGNNLPKGIAEFGLFTRHGLMLTHQVRGKVIEKDSDMVMRGLYYLHF